MVAHGLTKHFGDLVAVDGIDIEVSAGETFAFLGANGAGKTSARLVIMDHGRIIAQGSPRELIARHVTREVLEVRFGSAAQFAATTRLRDLDLAEVDSIEALAERAIVYTDDAQATLDALDDHDLAPRGHLVWRATLEDVFLRLTGRQLVD